MSRVSSLAALMAAIFASFGPGGNVAGGAPPEGTVRVSVSTLDVQGSGATAETDISATGRYVVFTSDAANLVSGDTNSIRDLFVRDRDSDGDGIFDEAGAVTTTRISVDTAGNQDISGVPTRPRISPDGRFVTFSSGATNLVVGDNNSVPDVFVRGRDTDVDGIFDEPGAVSTTRVSLSSSGAQGNFSSGPSTISANGRFVAFQSGSTTLVSGDTNNSSDIFVRDRDTPGLSGIAVCRFSITMARPQWSMTPPAG